jgi:hypothetical protein
MPVLGREVLLRPPSMGKQLRLENHQNGCVGPPTFVPQGQNTEPTLRLLENLVFIASESQNFGRTRPSKQ